MCSLRKFYDIPNNHRGDIYVFICNVLSFMECLYPVLVWSSIQQLWSRLLTTAERRYVDVSMSSGLVLTTTLRLPDVISLRKGDYQNITCQILVCAHWDCARWTDICPYFR